MTSHQQVSAGLVPDGRHFVSRARDEAASWRKMYKAPIPISVLAGRLGSYVQAYTLYSSVRPFGITSIVGGWDSEAEVTVDGIVGTGPSVGAGGKVEGARRGGPGLYMIEPSGMYWVSPVLFRKYLLPALTFSRATTAQRQARAVKLPRPSSRSLISLPRLFRCSMESRKPLASSTSPMKTARTRNSSSR